MWVKRAEEAESIDNILASHSLNQDAMRVLGQLASEGLIDQQYGKIEVLDPDRILELASEDTTG